MHVIYVYHYCKMFLYLSYISCNTYVLKAPSLSLLLSIIGVLQWAADNETWMYNYLSEKRCWSIPAVSVFFFREGWYLQKKKFQMIISKIHGIVILVGNSFIKNTPCTVMWSGVYSTIHWMTILKHVTVTCINGI